MLHRDLIPDDKFLASLSQFSLWVVVHLLCYKPVQVGQVMSGLDMMFEVITDVSDA